MSIKTLPPSLIETVKKVLTEKNKKPDYLDVDKDGNKKELMSDALKKDKSKGGKQHPFVKQPMEEATGVADQAVDPHNCATHVFHEQFGEGTPLFSQHAEPDEKGLIEWYDVMFDHGIERRVMVENMKILQTESHMSHKKKKKKG